MNYTDDTELPVLSEEEAIAFRDSARPYTVVVLKAGPNFAPPDANFESEVGKTIWKHGKRNMSLHMAGLLPIVCPISDGSGVCGICVFDASPEDADRIMSRDPGVTAGVFTYDVHPSRSFPGSSL